MVMKIENYETWKSSVTADTFSFPYNPISFDSQNISNHEIKMLPFSDHHIAISGGGHSPINLILRGHFSGSSKFTNYRRLSKHFHETWLLKKLYFESDKFFIGIGKDIKRTHTGGRTNFIDYVANFQSLFGIAFDDVEKNNSGGVVANEGDVPTYITEISGTITSGSSDLVISDNFGNEIKVSSSDLATSDSFVYRLISFIESTAGIYITTFGYCTINGLQVNTITKGLGVLKLASGEDSSDISISNLTSSVIKFRNGWSV